MDFKLRKKGFNRVKEIIKECLLANKQKKDMLEAINQENLPCTERDYQKCLYEAIEELKDSEKAL